MIGGSAFGSILLAVLGGVIYHASAKSIPKDLPPALVLVVAYASALGISALAYFSVPGIGNGAASPARLTHPAVIGVGLGAAMIELGYVLTYRAAWSVSVASVIVNGLVAALLVPLGVLVFGEHLSSARILGLLLCLAGVWLLKQ
jgi:drug/metabolite transporter (DMT)-like permease